MAAEEEEIKRLQEERHKKDLGLAKFGQSEGYDDFLYGDDTRKTLAVDDTDGPDAAPASTDDAPRRALPSYTAPEQFFREIPGEAGPDLEGRKKSVAQREDEYHARWRKRKLSPPKADPYNATLNAKERHMTLATTQAGVRTYRDAMKEHLLENEQADVERALARKQREEREEEEEERKRRAREGEQPAEKRARSSSSGWGVAVVKDGQTIEQHALEGGRQYRFGRDEGAEFVLAHPSCSTRHAKVKLDGDELLVVDLGSTNGTTLNGKDLATGQYARVTDGSIVRFGASSREYVFYYRR